MKAKDKSVKITGIKPELLFGLIVADGIYRKYGFNMVVTSVIDGEHSTGSFHYIGLAADLRINDIPPNIVEKILSELKEELVKLGFDVVFETNHIHIEFQPKTLLT